MDLKASRRLYAQHYQMLIGSTWVPDKVQEEAFHQMMVIGEDALRSILKHYLAHDHAERNHQGLGNQLIAPEPGLESHSGPVRHRDRLSGLLSYYYRDAA